MNDTVVKLFMHKNLFKILVQWSRAFKSAKKLSALLVVACVFWGCGDWDVGDSVHGSQTKFNFHYYYGIDCSWVGLEYLCGEMYSLSHFISVSVEIEWNGDAVVYYDGRGPYSYWDGDYIYDFDPEYNEFYYQFNLDGNYTLTIYDSGIETIYSDSWTGVEYHYYYN